MLIDVIIPTYNRHDLLGRSIQSVLDQSYQDFILHIVNDGSTDKTEKFLEQFADHPKIRIYHTENNGVSKARNLAAQNAVGEWLSFLDSDDEWMRDKLKTQTDFLKAHPSCEFIHAEELWIRNGVRVNARNKHQKDSDHDSGKNLFERSLHFCIISPSTVVMRKDLFFRHGGFNEKLVVCEDFDLWNKILLKTPVHFIKEPLVKKYGGHADQLSRKFVAMDYWRIKSLLDLYSASSVDFDQKEKIRAAVAEKSSLLLKNYLKHNNLKHYEEIKFLVQSIMPKV